MGLKVPGELIKLQFVLNPRAWKFLESSVRADSKKKKNQNPCLNFGSLSFIRTQLKQAWLIQKICETNHYVTSEDIYLQLTDFKSHRGLGSRQLLK